MATTEQCKIYSKSRRVNIAVKLSSKLQKLEIKADKIAYMGDMLFDKLSKKKMSFRGGEMTEYVELCKLHGIYVQGS